MITFLGFVAGFITGLGIFGILLSTVSVAMGVLLIVTGIILSVVLLWDCGR